MSLPALKHNDFGGDRSEGEALKKSEMYCQF